MTIARGILLHKNGSKGARALAASACRHVNDSTPSTPLLLLPTHMSANDSLWHRRSRSVNAIACIVSVLLLRLLKTRAATSSQDPSPVDGTDAPAAATPQAAAGGEGRSDVAPA
jgi:hypothetical protein